MQPRPFHLREDLKKIPQKIFKESTNFSRSTLKLSNLDLGYEEQILDLMFVAWHKCPVITYYQKWLQVFYFDSWWGSRISIRAFSYIMCTQNKLEYFRQNQLWPASEKNSGTSNTDRTMNCTVVLIDIIYPHTNFYDCYMDAFMVVPVNLYFAHWCICVWIFWNFLCEMMTCNAYCMIHLCS